jgi:YD repeat-containing protein
VDDWGDVTDYEYDTLDRETVMRFHDGSTRVRVYNEAGDVIQFTDENGSVMENTFDALGRKTQCDITQAAGVVGTDAQSFGYDGLSRQTQSIDTVGSTDATVQMFYDSMNRVLEDSQTSPLKPSEIIGVYSCRRQVRSEGFRMSCSDRESVRAQRWMPGRRARRNSWRMLRCVSCSSDWWRSIRVRRQISIELDGQTRDGDRVLRILTNLPVRRVSARTVANAYRDRWDIEAVNAQLVRFLDSEQKRLGNPPATLFAFCLSLVAFNLMTLVQGALRAAHGAQKTDDQVSNYHLAHQVRFAWAGTELVDDAHWEQTFANLTPAKLARQLKALAKQVNLEQLRKAPRGPQKPRTPRTRYTNTPHVATYRILHPAKAVS